MSSSLPDGGGPDVDPDVARDLAIDYLSDSLEHPNAASKNDVHRLVMACSSIANSLRDREEPDSNDFMEARQALRELDELLDDVAALHNIPRWKTGVQYGDLTGEEQRAMNEDCEGDHGDE